MQASGTYALPTPAGVVSASDTYAIVEDGTRVLSEETTAILRGNNVSIDASTINNTYSLIAATNNLTLGTAVLTSALEGDIGGVNINQTAASYGVNHTKSGTHNVTRHEYWYCNVSFFGCVDKRYHDVDYKTPFVEVSPQSNFVIPSIIRGGNVQVINAQNVSNTTVGAATNGNFASSSVTHNQENVIAQTTSNETISSTTVAVTQTIAGTATQSKNLILSATNSIVEGAETQPAAGVDVQSSDAITKSTTLAVISETAKSQPTPANGLTTDTLANLRVPDNALFKYQTTPSQGYLIETNQRFTDKETFLGSDYLLKGVSAQTPGTSVRLGDGFYEAKLVAQQISDLTAGSQFLEGYPTKAQQYQGLMDNAIANATQLDLRPGIF